MDTNRYRTDSGSRAAGLCKGRKRGTAGCRAGRPAQPLHGFTLVELLVVIAILSLLLSILTPAFRRARQMARRVVCQGNERAIGVGVLQYAQASNMWLPYANYSWSVRWLHKIGPYVGCETYGPVPYPSVGPQGSDEPLVWSCPETQHDFWLGYGWNYHGIGHTENDPRFGPTRFGGGKENCYLIADSAYSANVDYFAGSEGWSSLPTPSGIPWELQSRVHNDGLNVLYVKGHVEWRQTDDFLAAGYKIWGWFY